MLEFNTAVEELEAEQTDLEYTYGPLVVDGREMFFRKPEDGEYAVLMASSGRFASIGEKIGASVNLFNDVFREEDSSYLIGRLMDPSDRHFDFPLVAQFLEGMIEEWTGRPTRRSSGSTPRRPKTGSGSKRSTPAST